MRLKKGWTEILIIIAFISVMIISGETNKDSLFFIKGLIGVSIFVLSSVILIKYGRLD